MYVHVAQASIVGVPCNSLATFQLSTNLFIVKVGVRSAACYRWCRGRRLRWRLCPLSSPLLAQFQCGLDTILVHVSDNLLPQTDNWCNYLGP